MAKIFVEEESLTSVADSIRAKGKTTEGLIFPDGFKSAIDNIPSSEKPQFGDDFPLLDGNTHIWIERKIEEQNDTFEFRFNLINGDITFNWGDGTSETVSTTGSQTITHTYPIGQYRIDIVATGEWRFGSGSGGTSFITTSSRPLYSYIELGHNITYIGAGMFSNFIKLKKIALNLGDEHICYYYSQAFYYMHSLEEFKIYSGTLKEINTGANSNLFGYATSLVELDCSNIFITYLTNTFGYNYSLTNITGLKYITYLGGYTFRYCYSLSKLVLPKTLIDIGASVFGECQHLKILVLTSETVVTLANTNAFTNTPIANGNGYVYVPKALIEEYKVATNWATYSNQFRAIEDYPEIGELIESEGF